MNFGISRIFYLIQILAELMTRKSHSGVIPIHIFIAQVPEIRCLLPHFHIFKTCFMIRLCNAGRNSLIFRFSREGCTLFVKRITVIPL